MIRHLGGFEGGSVGDEEGEEEENSSELKV